LGQLFSACPTFATTRLHLRACHAKLAEQEAGLNPRQDTKTGPQGPDATEDARWRLRRRDPLRRKAAIKALIVPAFFLSLLGCALLVWALRPDDVAPVKDLRQQAAAALPVRAPEPANPAARPATPAPLPPAELAPILPPALPAAALSPPTPAEGLQSNPLRPTPEASPAPAALAMAPMRPAGSLTAPPGREAVINAQRETAAVATAAREAARPATSPAAAPSREREREPALQPASVEKAGDSFMIVLATVESESEARAQLQQLHKKYAGLGLKKLGYTRVKSGPDYVWRVRSTGLSEEEAGELCEKISAAGGKCTARSN
jgi:hypothetical protein